RQPEPALDPALPRLVAVVVDDALAPLPAKGGILRPRQESGVLVGDPALIIVAVQGPGLDLRAGQLAAVEQGMERVAVVIARLAHGPQPRFQCLGRQQLAHSSISMPSKATSQPWRSSSARSGESSSSAGLLLFTWMKTRR